MRLTILISLIVFFSCFTGGNAQDFAWAKNFEGSGNYSALSNKILVDKDEVYIVGQFGGTMDADPGPGVHNLICAGAFDGFIIKLDTAGNFIWAHSIGGSDGDVMFEVKVDGSRNVYVAGAFEGTIDFDPGPGIYQATSCPDLLADAYIWKLDANGNFIWAKTLYGPSNVQIQLDVDSAGNLYLGGDFDDTTDFDPGPGVYNVTKIGPTNSGRDAFISKWDTSGNLVWFRHIGNTSTTTIETLQLTKSHSLLITGEFYFTTDFDPGPGVYNMSGLNGIETFIMKLDTSGSFVWAKEFGGVGIVHVVDVVEDIHENIFSTGSYSPSNGIPPDFDPGPGIYNLPTFTSTCIFVCKFDSLANLIWAKGMGGTQPVSGYSIDVDANGNSYTSGTIRGTADLDPGSGSDVHTSAGSHDMAIVKLNNTGDFVWAETLGDAPYNDIPRGVSLSEGALYVTGDFMGTIDFNPGPDTADFTTAPGSVHAVVFKWHVCNGAGTPALSVSASSVCSGSPVILSVNGNLNDSHYWYVSAGSPAAAPFDSVPSMSYQFFPDSSQWFFVQGTGCYGDRGPRDSVFITVNSLPVISLNPLSDDSLCLNENPVALPVANPPGGNYTGAGIVGQLFDPFLAGPGSSIMYYSYTDANGCADTALFSITVFPVPIPGLGNDTSYCEGINFTGIYDAGHPGSTYSWSNGANTQSTVIHWADTISVIVTDSNNCAGKDSLIIVENPMPIVNLGSNTSYCEGNAWNAIYDAGNSGSIYLWSTGANTQTILVSSSGTYSVEVTDINGCTGYDTVVVSSIPLPVVNLGADVVTLNPPVILDAGNPGSVYVWSTNQTTQTISVFNNGEYYVMVTGPNGCSSADTIHVHFTLGIEPNENFSMFVHPNPADEFIQITGDAAQINQLRVMDASGKTVFEANAWKAGQQIHVSEWDAGLYFVQMQFTDRFITKKVLVK